MIREGSHVCVLGPNIHWTSNYGTGIVFIGNMLSWLSWLSFQNIVC